MHSGRSGKKRPPIRYLYTFALNGGAKKQFEVNLDPVTLNVIPNPRSKPPFWASMEFLSCEECPLNPKEHPFCPIAVNIADLIRVFGDVPSTEQATVTIETRERTVSKVCAVQSGLYSLLGIYMAASGCPVMDKLKPMVRFHLPFATIEETMYRVISMYLTAQYCRAKKGLEPDWTLEGLSKLYRNINAVNILLSERISKASKEDAAMNALVSLDVFTHFLQKTPTEIMGALEDLFEPYLRPDDP